MDSLTTILQLKEADEAILKDINQLLYQLKPDTQKDISLDHLKKILSFPSNRLFVALNNHNKVVGMVTLVSYPKVSGLFQTWIEDVVVDYHYQGKGIGKELIKKAIQVAKEENITTIRLTSRPSRVAANALYQKLGFKRVNTNYYKYSSA